MVDAADEMVEEFMEEDSYDGSSDGGYESEREEIEEEEEENPEIVVVERSSTWREDGVLETTFSFIVDGETRKITLGSREIIPEEVRFKFIEFVLEWGLYLS